MVLPLTAVSYWLRSSWAALVPPSSWARVTTGAAMIAAAATATAALARKFRFNMFLLLLVSNVDFDCVFPLRRTAFVNHLDVPSLRHAGAANCREEWLQATRTRG